jgi:ubiquinone/menaquinone biosynthesis C-methylase UbiE
MNPRARRSDHPAYCLLTPYSNITFSINMEKKVDSYSAQNAAQGSAITDPFSLERYAQFCKHLPIGTKTVLDVGCAEGRGGAHLKFLRPDLEISGLDCVRERLAMLPAAYSHAVHGLADQIPLPDQVVDAVLAGEFLEHLYPADVDPTLCEFQRVLKIGGTLLMTTPNPHSLKMRFRKGSVYSTAHLTQHYPDVLQHRLLQHGFSNVRLFGSGKATRHFRERFPILSIYGSYLITAKKI